MSVKIRNWGKFQHFKDRRPPWIKLYRELLDDLIWHELDAESAKTLVMLWLIASENGGILPPVRELSFRLRTTVKSVNSSISKLSHWLIQDDINVISDITAISEGYQETRLERETETETEKKSRATRFPEDSVLTDEWISEARKLRPDWINGTVERVFEAFKDYWLSVPGTKGTKNDWLATWRGWCRRETNTYQQASKAERRPSL